MRQRLLLWTATCLLTSPVAFALRLGEDLNSAEKEGQLDALRRALLQQVTAVTGVQAQSQPEDPSRAASALQEEDGSRDDASEEESDSDAAEDEEDASTAANASSDEPPYAGGDEEKEQLANTIGFENRSEEAEEIIKDAELEKIMLSAPAAASKPERLDVDEEEDKQVVAAVRAMKALKELKERKSKRAAKAENAMKAIKAMAAAVLEPTPRDNEAFPMSRETCLRMCDGHKQDREICHPCEAARDWCSPLYADEACFPGDSCDLCTQVMLHHHHEVNENASGLKDILETIVTEDQAEGEHFAALHRRRHNVAAPGSLRGAAIDGDHRYLDDDAAARRADVDDRDELDRRVGRRMRDRPHRDDVLAAPRGNRWPLGRGRGERPVGDVVNAVGQRVDLFDDPRLQPAIDERLYGAYDSDYWSDDIDGRVERHLGLPDWPILPAAPATASVIATPPAAPPVQLVWQAAPPAPAPFWPWVAAAAKPPWLAWDCDDGLSDWQTGWSDAKKTWCCANLHKGCPEPVVAVVRSLSQLSQSSRPASLPKPAPAAPGGVGAPAPALPPAKSWDCQDGISAWETDWSDEKKDWCCKSTGLTCKTSLFQEESAVMSTAADHSSEAAEKLAKAAEEAGQAMREALEAAAAVKEKARRIKRAADLEARRLALRDEEQEEDQEDGDLYDGLDDQDDGG
eukprot:TRINITY_DN122660_c0_g1_i1.p1 TRINITY_DN122660_c0_g1~~TRINITY_DN122660_c0_g1_i1.p1  ORF type:complete len:686 (+),score=187.22 TRINITY_DN122660_c0_g1_i1:158-2215(+)